MQALAQISIIIAAVLFVSGIVVSIIHSIKNKSKKWIVSLVLVVSGIFITNFYINQVFKSANTGNSISASLIISMMLFVLLIVSLIFINISIIMSLVKSKSSKI